MLFLRNARDHVPRKVDHDRLRELRWRYNLRSLAEGRRDLGDEAAVQRYRIG